MKILKPSYFNFVINVSDDDYLLYNTKNTGLIHLNSYEGKLIETLNSVDKFDLDHYEADTDLLTDLYDKGFFMDHEIDEKELLRSIYNLGKDVHNKDSTDINLTIGTTILCNMGCSYCFEFVKPNKRLKDENVINGIITYLKDMISNSPVKEWRNLNVVWYGGEPLINKEAIVKLSPLLMDLCYQTKMNYKAEIITNGLLLDKDTWTTLKDLKVKNVQVTIDGPKEIHDENRPLLGGKNSGENYDKIMKNLSLMPEEMNLTIRVNLDKRVFQKFDVLLNDLKNYGIWPQRHKNVHIKIAWLRTYDEELDKKVVTGRLDVSEFYYASNKIKLLKREIYNQWARENGLKDAKIKWDLPELQAECATWVSPYSMVIDPEGNIHKCWETIHDEKEGLNHVLNGYKPQDYDLHSQYDRYRVSHIKCNDCKYIPICDQLSCSHQVVGEKEPPCTHWKYVLTDSLKDQFLYMKENPDKMVLVSESSNNTGHSNK